VPIRCKDAPGFLINRLKAALVNEAITMLEEGVSTAEEIDDAVRLGFAPRFAIYGPLLANDLTGKKSNTLAVTRNLYERLGRPQFKPPRALEEKVEAGDLGIEYGGGWYRLGTESSDKIMKILNRRDEALYRIYRYLNEINDASWIKKLRNGL
jgi:3-hydroxybutyryl-CoA dehydrogenase